MPLARIDLPAGKPAGCGRAVADVVYEAMIATLNARKNDRFQVISEHARANLIIDPTYLGIERSADALIIQLALSEGRTVEVKKASTRQSPTACTSASDPGARTFSSISSR
jgi:4-oxalocrotonate tautomerase